MWFPVYFFIHTIQNTRQYNYKSTIKPITYSCESQESGPYIYLTLAKWIDSRLSKNSTQRIKLITSVVHNKIIWLQDIIITVWFRPL